MLYYPTKRELTMAVNIKKDGTNQDQTQNQGQQQQQYQQSQGQAYQGQRANTGFTPSFGIQSRLAGFGTGGDTFEKIHEVINNKVKYLNEELKTEEKYAVVKVLKGTAGLNYSAIVLCETLQDITSAHILMIEKTGDYPEKLIENIGGARYEIVRTPADALDDRYVQQVQQAVADALRVDFGSIVITDGTLVPNEFDINSESQVEDLIRNTFNAVHSENAIRVQDYKGMNLAELFKANPNGKFVINTYFNGEKTQYFDKTGMPVRQDICIVLSYKTNQGVNHRSINQGNDTFEVVKTYGYVDFEFTAPEVYQGVMSTRRFLPNFIITGIDSQTATTPDIMMLGVASVLSLNEEMDWLQAFRSRPGRKGEIDYNDIGALNIEGNIEQSPTGFGKLYNTKAKEFSVLELNNFVQTLVRPNMAVSIDIPKAGPDTWYTSVFQYIMFRKSQSALARVIDGISALTNGAFVNNAPIFTDITNRIHGGYYRTKDGFEDIRQLSSYLGVANHVAATNQQPSMISQYTNTLYNIGIPSEIRAAERGKMIDELSGGTAVYKQFYDRLTFTAPFLTNLIRGLKEVGFNPVFSNMGHNNDLFMRRSSVDFSGAALGQDVRLMGQNNLYSGYGGNNMNYTRTY